MDAKQVQKLVQSRAIKLDIQGGYVPPKLPVTTARIKPTSPPPKKGTDKKSK